MFRTRNFPLSSLLRDTYGLMDSFCKNVSSGFLLSLGSGRFTPDIRGRFSRSFDGGSRMISEAADLSVAFAADLRGTVVVAQEGLWNRPLYV